MGKVAPALETPFASQPSGAVAATSSSSNSAAADDETMFIGTHDYAKMVLSPAAMDDASARPRLLLQGSGPRRYHCYLLAGNGINPNDGKGNAYTNTRIKPVLLHHSVQNLQVKLVVSCIETASYTMMPQHSW